MKLAVVGHVEWIDFVKVDRLPEPGAIIHGSESWEEPGGGGAVAASAMAGFAGSSTFFTALGDDERGHRALRELTELGIEVHAVFRAEPQRRAIVLIDHSGERTITVLGSRLWPSSGDPLPWDKLAQADAVYLTAGDVGAVNAARAAKVLTATPRLLPVLRQARVRLDALIGSSLDPGERYHPGDIKPEPEIVVQTAGASGGRLHMKEGKSLPFSAVELAADFSDTYGAGDNFAAGFTYALGAGQSPLEAANFGARCGAAAVASRGAHGPRRLTPQLSI